MTSPSSPSPSIDRSYSYYYFVVAIAVIVVLLLTTNIAVIGCCSRCRLLHAIKLFLYSRGLLPGPSSSEDDYISQLIPARKYKKEQAAGADGECSVCLMPFAEGEEVRQLPKCKHSFHAPCIDMWLYSHSNCPMCRADVLPEGLWRARVVTEREDDSQSQRSTIESGSMSGVIVSLM